VFVCYGTILDVDRLEVPQSKMQIISWYPSQHTTVQNWILILWSNKTKTEKQTKCGNRFL